MDPIEIKPDAIYTTRESQDLLKVSSSTMKRLLKNGVIRANKIGRQYRILGRELLRLISPEVEGKAARLYLTLKEKVKNKIKDW